MREKNQLNQFMIFILSIPLAVVIFLAPSVGFSQKLHGSPPTSNTSIKKDKERTNKEAYVASAYYIFPSLLAFLSQESDFTKGLAPTESQQFNLLFSILTKKVMEAYNGFPGGIKYELFDRIGIKYSFSDNPSDFILNDGKPERAAKTTETWSDPIVFNRRIVNSSAKDINFLDTLAIFFHEMGHKLGKEKNQEAIDSIASKMKSYLLRFYSTATSTSGAKVEVLSLPTFISEISFGFIENISPMNLTFDLIFYSNVHKETGLIKFSTSIESQIHNLQRATSYGYNILNNSNIRITGVNLLEEMKPDSQIELELDHIYQLGVLDSIGTTAVNGSVELQSHPQINSLLKPESLRITLPYTFKPDSRLSENSYYWTSFNSYHSPRYDKRLSGMAQNVEISIDQAHKNKVIISTKSPLGTYKDYNILGVKAFRNTIHLRPVTTQTMGNHEIKTYELPLSNEVPRTDFEVKYLVHQNFDDKLLLAKQATFTAGKGSLAQPSSLSTISYLFYNAGKGWQLLPETGLTEIASLQPGIGLNLEGQMKVAEIKIIWKKAAEITYKGQSAGTIAGFETEVFTPGEFGHITQNGITLLYMKSKKFSIPYDPPSLIPDFKIRDNGFREIREIVVVGENYSQYSQISRPFDAVDPTNGIQAPIAMIDEVRRTRATTTPSTPKNHTLVLQPNSSFSLQSCKKLFN